MSRYSVRDQGQLSPTAKMLASDGISVFEPLYSEQDLKNLNGSLDDLFAAQSHKARAYATIEDMARLGLLDVVLGGRMRDVLTSVARNPVLYHCHIYEIAGRSTKSHIFSESLAGWHRDPDSLHFRGDPTHVSIFVYLTNVGPEDGAFEFSPVDPEKWIHSSTPVIKVCGPVGFSFAWHRSFYHRASPNRGDVRRRLLKISVQPNEFESIHLSNSNFRAACEMVPAGDAYTDLLLGRYQGKPAPRLPPSAPITGKKMASTGVIGLPESQMLKAQAREKVRFARRWLREKARGSSPTEVAYD